MTDKPKQASFFIQDPFTEELQGPMSVQDLKQWYAKGAVEGWGVSKSPNGPWQTTLRLSRPLQIRKMQRETLLSASLPRRLRRLRNPDRLPEKAHSLLQSHRASRS